MEAGLRDALGLASVENVADFALSKVKLTNTFCVVLLSIRTRLTLLDTNSLLLAQHDEAFRACLQTAKIVEDKVTVTDSAMLT